ncbi:PAS domain S-box protein [Desulfobulbus sp.]|uniref:PAS domain S-box protein n=1 Tax=Desulfobulbus sp. TaxID=895 RepID=UPI00286F4A5C|nr:PAS domain S-box protein [Desulfobulbus sp.]
MAAWLAADSILDRQKQLHQQAAGIAQNFIAAVDRELDARIRALEVLAMSPLINDPDRWPELYAEARAYHNSLGNHFILADTGEPMQMLFNTNHPFGTAPSALPLPDGHAAAPSALVTGRPAIGDTFPGPVVKQAMVTVVVPVVRNDQTTHLFLAFLEAEQFQELLDQVAFPDGWAVTLLDGRDNVIARRASQGFNGGGDANEKERFVSHSSTAAWSAMVEIPRSVIHMPLLSATAILSLAVLAASAASAIGGLHAGRRLGRQVAALADAGSPDEPSLIAEIVAARKSLADADARLRHSEALWAATIEQATVGIAVVAVDDGRHLAANHALGAMFGYSREELLATSCPQLSHPDEVAEDQEHLERLLADEATSYTREKRCVARDGTVFWAQIGVSLIRQPDGTPDCFVVVAENIQARKAIEAAVRESSRMLNDMAAMAHIGGWSFDLASAKGSWTAEAARIHDLPEDTPMDIDICLGCFTGEHRPAIETAARAVIDRAIGFDLELEMRTWTGRCKWVRILGHPVMVEGKVIQVQGTIQDITNRKLAEMALAKSEQSYREVVENANSAILRWSSDGIITFANAFAQQLFGWDRTDLSGRHIGVLVPERESTGADLSGLVADIAAYPERHRSNINENIRRDGSRLWMAWTNRAVRNAQGQVAEILALGNDITEHKLLLEELKRRNEELERFNRASVDRELRMIELKRTINQLSSQLGRRSPHDISFVDEP